MLYLGGGVAHLAEQLLEIPEVRGSNSVIGEFLTIVYLQLIVLKRWK